MKFLSHIDMDASNRIMNLLPAIAASDAVRFDQLLWSNITGKPSVANQVWYGTGQQTSTFAFDGTVLTAPNITTNTLNINSNAPLQFNSRNSWRTYQTTQIGDNTIGWNIQGAKLILDEEFSIGLNGLQIYNNAGGTALTMTRSNTTIAGTVVPNSTGFYVKMQADNSSLGTTPGFGGFVPAIPGVNVQPNKTYIQRFRALLPVGYNFELASNGIGTEGVHYWLTSQAGTGKWEEYVRICKAGVTGSFSSSFHVYVSGSPAPTVAVPLVWYLASHTVIDATNLNEISAQVGSFPILEGANGSVGTVGQLPINTGGAWNWTNSPYALATSITGTNHFVPKSNGAGGYIDSKLFQNNGALILDAVSPYFNMRNNGVNAITFGTDDALTAGSATDAHLYVYGANKLFLSTNGIKTFTIFGNQNIGIGSTTDNSLGKLQVTGSVYSTTGFFTTASTVGIAGDGSSLYLKAVGNTYLNTSNNSYINNAGGIYGTSVNSTGLVRGTVIDNFLASNGYVKLTQGGTGNSGYIEFYRPNNTRAAYIGFATGTTGVIDYNSEGVTTGNTAHNFIGGIMSLNNQRITNVANAVNSGDVVTLGQSDARYAKLTGATFTGAITSNSLINTSSSIIGGAIAINAVNPAIYRDLLWQTNGLNRWDLGVVGAESGSNNGSNMFLARYSDAGTYLGSIFDINRASGLLQFNQEVRGVAGSASTSLVVKSQLDAIGANISGTVNTYPIFTATGAIGNGNIAQNTTQIITSKPIFTNNGSVNLFNDGATGNSGLGVNLYWDNAQWNYNNISYWGGRGNMLFINPISSNRFIFYESSNAANPAVLVQLAALSGTGLFIANGGFNSNNQKVINVANATAATDAVNKGQLDAAVSGTTNQIAYFTGTNTVSGSSMYWHNSNGLSFNGNRATPHYIYARGAGDDASLKLRAGSSVGYYSEISIDGWDGTGTASNINFRTGGADQMRLIHTGNLMLGTTTDLGAKLGIVKNSTWNNESSAGIYIQSGQGATNTGLLLGTDKVNNVGYIQIVEPSTSYGTKRLALNPNGGNVGVGLPAPLTAFHVQGLESRFGGIGGSFISLYNASTRSGFIQANAGVDLRLASDTDPMTFWVGGSEKMQLTGTVSRTIGLSKQNFYTNNSNTYRDVMYYDNNARTITGAFVIETPIVTTGVDNMLSLKILGYNYSGHGAWEVRIGGYTYNTTIPTWLNHSAEIIGNAPFTTVRLARNPATNKYIIILGGVTDNSWSYPKIHVSELIAGYSTTNNLGTGWSGSFVTDVSAYTGMVTVNTQKVFKGYGVGTYQNTPAKLLGVDANGAVVETNPITSNISGTSSYIPLFTSTNTIGNSGIYQSNPTLWGFGTASPVGVYGSTVHVKSSTGGSVNLGGTTVAGYLSMSDGLGTGVLGTSSNHPMVFITNGLERARYFTSGNIQFGGAGAITDNGNSLQVYKTGTSTFISVDAPTNGSFATPAQSGLKMLGYNGENARIAGLDYAANYSYSGLAFSTLNNASVLTERARFSGANGDFGIGTTTPQQKLHLANSGAVGIRLDNTAANTWDIVNTAPSGTLDFIRGGTTWASIGAGGVATFNNNVATTGSFTATGGFYSASKLVALGSSSYVTLYRADGVAGIFLGGTSDPNSYYDNTTHIFRNLAGSASLAQINSGGINIFGGKISNLANGTVATDAAAFGQIGTAVTNLLGTTNTWTAGNNFSAGLSSLNLNVGNSSGDNNIQIGLAGTNGATGNRYAYLDLIGDNTYTDYGLRLIRGNTGANANSQLVHRGTGLLELNTNEAAPIHFVTNSTTRVVIQANGVTQCNSAITQKSGSGAAKSNYVFSFDDGTASKTGVLVLELPVGWNNTMSVFTIEGYDYSSKGAWKVDIGGYNYNSGTPATCTWVNTSVQNYGNPPFSTVKLGFNAATGKNVIMLGAVGTVWAYPKFTVSVTTAHSYADYMNIGWSASWVVSEAAYTFVTSPPITQNLLGQTTTNNLYTNTLDIKSQGYGLFYNLDNTNYSGIRNTGATGAANSNLDFFVGGNTVSRITPSGWLSLGTLSPISKLHVTTNAATATYATIGNMNGGIMIGTAANGENQIINYASKGLVFGGNFSTTQTEQMRLDASGNLGVGISPTGRLDVLGASSLSRLVIGYQGTGVNYLDGSDLNVRTAGGTNIATFNAAGINLIAPTTVEFFGHPRSVRAGYSGGNYGSISYGINYTTTSNSHTYAGGDFPTRVDLYDGIYVTSAPTGTNGAAITWTQVAHLRRGGSTLYTSLSMASNKITALANGTATDEAVNLGQLQTINGSWITAGTIADARLSSNVALYNGSSYFTVSQRFRKNTVNDGQSYNNANIVLHTSDGSFPTIGFHNEGVYGAALQMRSGTDLVLQNSGTISYKIFHEGNYGVFNLSSVSTGTLADARLTGNVALKNINNNFTAAQTITATGADVPLNLTKASGTEWNYAQFNYAGTRRAYFGIESGANFIIGLDGTNKDIILVPTGTGAVNVSTKKIINLANATNASDALPYGQAETLYAKLTGAAFTGGVSINVANPEGGNIQIQNTSKTGAIANNWVLYNMTGGYGNGLVFWSYNQSGGVSGRTFNINDDGTLDAVRGTISANDATAARHLINRQTGDARYGQLTGANTWSNTNTFSFATNFHGINARVGNLLSMYNSDNTDAINLKNGGTAGSGSGYLQFLSNLAETARLTWGGNLLLNTTTDNGAKLQVNGNTTVSGLTTTNTLTVSSVTTETPNYLTEVLLNTSGGVVKKALATDLYLSKSIAQGSISNSLANGTTFTASMENLISVSHSFTITFTNATQNSSNITATGVKGGQTYSLRINIASGVTHDFVFDTMFKTAGGANLGTMTLTSSSKKMYIFRTEGSNLFLQD